MDARPHADSGPDDAEAARAAPAAPTDSGAEENGDAIGTLSSALRLAVARLARRLRQQAAGQVTASQQSALASVKRFGPVSLGELASIERIAPPSMTRIATRLETAGLVERRTDESDRRVARVAITDAGRDLLRQIQSRRDLYLAERIQCMSPAERHTLSEALPLLERLASDQS